MRPLRIEVEGFSTFRDRTVVELDGLSLVAFTGQTGSGKSSLIDAMTFALYGSVARYGKENLVAPVIHQLAAEARVRLDFEVSGKRYAAVRVLRRKAQKNASAPLTATTREARLESLDTGEVLAGSVKELNAAVIELLGLDFTQFTRTIVLPQGDFAEFLNDEPANRQKLLRRLLDMEIYVRMGKAARAEAKRAELAASTLESEQQRTPAPTDDHMRVLKAKQAALAKAQPGVEIALGELGTLSTQRQQLLDEHKVAKQTVGRLSEVAVPETMASADRKLQELNKAKAEAKVKLDDAKLQLEQASADERDDLAGLSLTIDRLDRLAILQADSAASAGTESELAETVERLERRNPELEAERDVTQATYETAQSTASAASWVEALSVGEPCPVCQQTVAAIPDHDADLELSRARGEATVAAESYRVWEKQHSEAVAELRALGRTVATQDTARLELEKQLSSGGIDLALTGKLSAPAIAEQIQTLRTERDAALAAAQVAKAARSDVDQAQQQLAEADSRFAEIESQIKQESLQFSAIRDSLSDLEPPAVSNDSPIENWQTLAEWAAEKIGGYEDQASQVVEQGHKVAALLIEKEAVLRQMAESLGLPHGEHELPGLPNVMLVAATKAQAEINEADRQRAQAQDRQQRILALRKERELNKSLGSHLDAAGFEGWLLNEALDNIVGKATERLLQLSGGQYSLLATDRQFSIIDHNNADERRDVRTLSGGETFLASLALALALADSIAELAPVDAPRLESMFLDEGFGTLDPETLDVVASAIEELAADGRMIGIVTHVRELAERLPVRFEITKGPTSSSVKLVEL